MRAQKPVHRERRNARELADGSPVASGIAFDMQQQQILQRCQAVLARHLLAEALKLAYLITKIRQYFKIMFVKGWSFGYCCGHGDPEWA